jgi:hypothetical protein
MLSGLLYLLGMIIYLSISLKYDTKIFMTQLKACDTDKELHIFIKDKLEEITKEENILLVIKDYEELNVNRAEDDKIVGCYFYNNKNDGKELLERFDTLKSDILKTNDPYLVEKVNKIDRTSFVYPRIELCENDSTCKNRNVWFYFTWMHELGHHFIHKNNIQCENEEKMADKWCLEFFDKYMPDYYKWLFSTYIEVYADTKIKLNDKEMYRKYLKNIKKN